MQFSCESCKAQLQIADEKVKGKRLIVRCRRCGAKIVIADPSLSKAPPRLVQPPVPAAPAPMRVAPLPQAVAATAGPAWLETDVEDPRAKEGEAPERPLQASKGDEPIQNGAPSPNEASSLARAASQNAAPSRPPPPPVAPPEDAPVWFAMLHGKQTGPLTRAEVVGKTDAAEIGPRTYLWKEGMSAWQRAKDVPELAGLFPQPPGPSLPPPLPIASSAPAPPPRPHTGRKTSSLAPDLRRPVPSGAPPREAPAPKAKEDRSPIDANLSQVARPQDGTELMDATQKNAAELARWATEELARMPSAPERPAQAPRPSMFESAAPERKNGAFLVFVVLAILAAAALALWLGLADREKKPPPGSEKSEIAPPPGDPPARPAVQARAEAPPPEPPEAEPAVPAGGLTPAQVRRKLDESRGALQGCIDDVLRREPNLRVGRIHIATTIAPSGQVTSARIDKRAVDESALGACLKRATRRIAFPQFGGDAFDVDIPIVVTAGE